MYESKYEQFPDNFSLEKRMENGESLKDIFDDTDYNYKCCGTREAPNRPITVRIKNRFNYVVKGALLFENWFASCREFENFDEYSYAYRDTENDYLTRGVFFNKFGKFIIKEEFNHIRYGGGKYAIVEQKNGKLNIIDLEKGVKASENGLEFDAISENNKNYDFDIFIIENGIKNVDYWSPGEVPISIDRLNEDLKGIKYNFYKFGVGLLSNEWFDLIERFEIASTGYGYNYIRWNAFCAVVYKNNKYNFITQKGELLSPIWFDIASVNGIYGGNECAVGGMLKSQNAIHLSDFLITDNYCGFNPQKFDIYEVSKKGELTKQ